MQRMRDAGRLALLAGMAICAGCAEVLNDPYPQSERHANVLYTAFVDRPKHLDPVQSYTEDESRFTQQIYEPPLQYHYFRRPHELVPLTASALPAVRYLDAAGVEVPPGDPRVAHTLYEIRIAPGIRYQPHPAFARSGTGEFLHHTLDPGTIHALASPYALPAHASRELDADDYVYQIKRLAHPRLHSPILGLMTEYITGMREFTARMKALNDAMTREGRAHDWIDLRQHTLEGVERIDRHTFRVRIKGSYPQFAYWLAMPFFAPVPWEVDRFFHQPGMAARNFTLDWWPVGTGPYMLTGNNPNARMVLVRNPEFRGEPYPSQGEPADHSAGLLADAGRPMPFIDRVVFSREKESIPYWNKFLQGYYDFSGIGSDNFDQAVRVSVEGEAGLTPAMQERGIRLRTSVATTILYLGVNWLDPLVGGSSERARKLRQALAVAIDWEEYLSIFANGRGIVAHSPLAPGIFGYREGQDGLNALTHRWERGRAQRRELSVARQLLAEAGYPDGRDAHSGQPLVLHLDTVSRGPGDKARLDWWRKQFAKLSIQLEIRDTDWNRFQEKIRQGSQQLFFLGWNADYPDPENFLFLLHGPQSRARGQGENSANYRNEEFDRLFERMKGMPNGVERQQHIDRMVEIVRRDLPWLGGYHPRDYALFHAWLMNQKPSTMARNDLKYLRIDVAQRAQARAEWNRPVWWPLLLLALAVVAGFVPALLVYRRRERRTAGGGLAGS